MKDRQHPIMDWNEFEKFMVKQFPFMPDGLWKESDERLDPVGDYVQKTLKRFFKNRSSPHPYFNPFADVDIDYDIFESHRSVFVQCRLPKETSLHDMNFSVNKRRLKIKHADKTQEILLSCDVDPSRSKATFKDGMLEIRLPKKSSPGPYHDIEIQG